ncbi:MAG: ribosome biogenesis GTP-binding protein YihA/YsxC [Bacilli bacterium]|nr:ribosome biogenesis GTP-binding protein YihA/YsxC [Bacilli bacterium]
MTINFLNATFAKSAPSLKEAPQGQFPEVLLVGKSNVGKSSLINALCNKKALAFTSSKPGHTRLLNYYNIDNKIYLVDAPGYGYAKGGFDLDKLFGEMMDDYFTNASRLKLVLVLLDSRRELSENDVDIINFIREKDIDHCLVFTKSDKINQSEKAHLLKHLSEIGVEKDEIIFTSTLKTRTFDSLRNKISSI